MANYSNDFLKAMNDLFLEALNQIETWIDEHWDTLTDFYVESRHWLDEIRLMQDIRCELYENDVCTCLFRDSEITGKINRLSNILRNVLIIVDSKNVLDELKKEDIKEEKKGK